MPKDEGLTQARPRIAYRHQAYLKRICCLMATLRLRPIMLEVIAALALLLVFSLVTTLAAGAVSASVPSVRNLVIRSVTIDPQTKVATVRGAVTCTGAESVEVFVDVRQKVGRLYTVSASGAKELDCGGRVSFSLRLRNFEGRLGPGDAEVEATAFTCNEEACFGTDFFRVMRVTNAS